MAETANGFKTVGALLGLHALTSLHPGTGTALGTVDLPIQRERHTQWPTISGSALKGVLRDACRERIAARRDLDEIERYDDRPGEPAQRSGSARARADATVLLNDLFGPPTAGADRFAGALSLTDARILAFPVRSLKGLFAWVSCPAILDRLRRDLSLIGAPAPWSVPDSLSANSAFLDANSPCLVESGTRLVLEEFEFTRREDGNGTVGAWIARALITGTEPFAALRRRLPAHFVVLSDDDFTHFARHATEVTARIGLDYENKTVKRGALFYQEFLPPETLFYSVVLANGSRSGPNGKNAAEILGLLHVPPVLQVGGDETTGKGLCATRLWSAETREEAEGHAD
jgi:CRISPR-associated protein Cmr4